MTRDLAITWVGLNCPNRALRQDVLRLLRDATSKGLDWWFVVGGDLTRKKVPFLLHCLGDQVFNFQLTGRKAAALGVAPDQMQHGTSPHQLDAVPAPPQVSIQRFQLEETSLRPDQPIRGSVDVEVAGHYPGYYAVRLDHSVEDHHRAAYAYPMQPLHGKQSLEVGFNAIGPVPALQTMTGRPLAVFVHLVRMEHPADLVLNRPISHAAAALVELVGPGMVAN